MATQVLVLELKDLMLFFHIWRKLCFFSENKTLYPFQIISKLQIPVHPQVAGY